MKFLFGLLGLGFIGGGIIAVYAYRRRVPGAVLGLGAGSLLGALSGFLGFLVVSVLVGIQVMLTNKGEEFRRTAFESMDKTVQNADPQLQRQFQEAVLRFKTPEGFIFFIVLGCVFLLAAFVFFSVLGGAIGASISRRKLK